MRYFIRVAIATSILPFAFCLLPSPAIAQLTPDASLGTLTTPAIINGQPSDIVIDGTAKGSNLFHSFTNFNVAPDRGVYFNNPVGVTNIFTRVTGTQHSSIEGSLGVLGTANLFLLNPNGMLFGTNARLDLRGSFISTTADSIRFSDGIEFSAKQPTALLTMSVPIGLQMGQNPGKITVQGTGQTLLTLLPRSIPVPTKRDPNNTGLTLASGKTLALIGGEIEFKGGIVTAEQGHIELSAVRSGTVGLDLQASQRFALNYAPSNTYGNLQFADRSLVDVSGTVGGSIALRGQNLNFSGGSMVLNQNLGSQSAGITRIDAIATISFKDSIATAQTAIRSEALGTGQGSPIELYTQQLRIDAGGSLDAVSYGDSKAGSLQVNATQKVEVNGRSPLPPFSSSGIASSTFGNSQGSTIDIKTPAIVLSNGGAITASAFGRQRGSDINIQASDIWVSGLNPVIQFPSTIAGTAFSTGQGGNVMISADRISVRDIGTIASSTLAQGPAGTLTIRASEWMEVNGSEALIRSSAPRVSPVLQKSLNLSAIPTGSSGNLSLYTPQLRILNGGRVSVRSDGPGRSGNLRIEADAISLEKGGQITASTVSGNGGNIQLNVQDYLFLQNNSIISNNSFGIGDGGQTHINAPIVLGLGNSDITANAVQGRGGNIQITTQGIFGLKFRDRLTPDNDITASSQFGVNGNVQVNQVGVDPNSGLAELPSNLVDANQTVRDRCHAQSGSSFVMTGRGGMLADPTQDTRLTHSWSDLRSFPLAPTAKAAHPGPSTPILVEANTIRRNPQTGTMELIGDPASQMASTPASNCAAIAPAS